MESRVSHIVSQVRGLGPEERERRLAELCEGDAELEAEVRRRLAEHLGVGGAPPSESHSAGSEDATSAGGPSSPLSGESLGTWPTMQPVAQEHVGDHIGPYKLLEQIGEGGFGVVWLAEQRKPVRRRVALKLVKPGMDSGSVLARFEAERQALAMLEHPNVARVLDGGTTPSGRPYFVMEYVPGLPITKFVDQKKLELDDRLRLFHKVCDAISHAHQKGIIHRDLKPSNILIREVEGAKPEPKVIDFGVAKAMNASLTERTLYTQHGQLVGTPAYMPPEQAGKDSLEVDTRADIYSLGVVLYELLTGQPPFDPKTLREAGYEEMIRIVREVEPQRPSARLSTISSGSVTKATTSGERQQAGAADARMRALSRRVRGDLDWVVMRCLEKERTRRYAAVTELAKEVDRYLRHDPVEAGPPSASYRIRKFVRRHRPAVAAAAAAVVFLVVYAGTATALTIEANRQKSIAQAALDAEAEARAEADAMNSFLQNDLLRAADPLRDGPDVRVVDVLARGADAAEAKFADRPRVRARVLASIGMTFVEIGSPRQAAGPLRDAISGLEPFVEGDPELASQIGELKRAYAQSLWESDRADRAVEYISAAIADGSATVGGVGAELDATHQLANALKQAGRFEEAVEVYADVIERSTEALGAEHRDTINARYNLALVDIDRAKPIEVEDNERFVELTGRALERLADLYAECRDAHGADDPMTVLIGSEIATSLNRLDRFAEASAAYGRVLPTMRQQYGARHFRTIQTLANAGRLELKAGNYQQAIDHLREACMGMRDSLGAAHGDTITATGWLADALEGAGRPREAARVLERAYLDLEDHKPGSFELRDKARRLAEIYDGLDEVSRAERWRSRAAEFASR
jgi:serine/threonine protein kinase/tetratricopeptide (TPR) repeat protein